MVPPLELSGTINGWTVLGRTGSDAAGNARWSVRCICGCAYIRTAKNVKHTTCCKSCAALVRERFPEGRALVTDLIALGYTPEAVTRWLVIRAKVAGEAEPAPLPAEAVIAPVPALATRGASGVASSMITKEQISRWFTYHAPKPAPPADGALGDAEKYGAIREKAAELAALIVELTPESADQTHAVRLIRTAVMFANAAITCEGK